MPRCGCHLARAQFSPVPTAYHRRVPGAELPRAEFGFPGPLRDQLVAAILDGRKVSTTSLELEYRIEDEPLPERGRRSVVVDSADRAVAIIETLDVAVVPLGMVDLAHAVDEGEGHCSLADWRADHERFWHDPMMREHLGSPGFTVDDGTLVVLERFKVVERLS